MKFNKSYSRLKRARKFGFRSLSLKIRVLNNRRRKGRAKLVAAYK